MSGWRYVIGAAAVCLGVGGGLLLVLALPTPLPPRPEYGVSFSAPHATGIGLDWHAVYTALLDDLGVRRLRLAAYWDQLEPEPGDYEWEALDWQMDEAEKRGAHVLLAVGRKLPRWPECHVPAWARELPEAEQRARVLAMTRAVVERYRLHPALQQWQVENEPLLDFGECPPVSVEHELFVEEVELVRKLDAIHPIVVTDSGELNWWIAAAEHGDRLGTTMYRTVFSHQRQRLFSYDYWFPAWLYRLKARVVWLVRGTPVLVAELQGEPWGAAPFTVMSESERRASLTPERLVDLGQFAARSQLSPIYWWGAEYWYWEKEVQGEPAFWEAARQFFR